MLELDSKVYERRSDWYQRNWEGKILIYVFRT